MGVRLIRQAEGMKQTMQVLAAAFPVWAGMHLQIAAAPGGALERVATVEESVGRSARPGCIGDRRQPAAGGGTRPGAVKAQQAQSAGPAQSPAAPSCLLKQLEAGRAMASLWHSLEVVSRQHELQAAKGRVQATNLLHHCLQHLKELRADHGHLIDYQYLHCMREAGSWGNEWPDSRMHTADTSAADSCAISCLECPNPLAAAPHLFKVVDGARRPTAQDRVEGATGDVRGGNSGGCTDPNSADIVAVDCAQLGNDVVEQEGFACACIACEEHILALLHKLYHAQLLRRECGAVDLTAACFLQPDSEVEAAHGGDDYPAGARALKACKQSSGNIPGFHWASPSRRHV